MHMMQTYDSMVTLTKIFHLIAGVHERNCYIAYILVNILVIVVIYDTKWLNHALV